MAGKGKAVDKVVYMGNEIPISLNVKDGYFTARLGDNYFSGKDLVAVKAEILKVAQSYFDRQMTKVISVTFFPKTASATAFSKVRTHLGFHYERGAIIWGKGVQDMQIRWFEAGRYEKTPKEQWGYTSKDGIGRPVWFECQYDKKEGLVLPQSYLRNVAGTPVRIVVVEYTEELWNALEELERLAGELRDRLSGFFENADGLQNLIAMTMTGNLLSGPVAEPEPVLPVEPVVIERKEIHFRVELDDDLIKELRVKGMLDE